MKDKNIVFYSKTLKSRLELIFPINNDNIYLNTRYEKDKKFEIIIELKDNIDIWKIIENRINNIN